LAIDVILLKRLSVNYDRSTDISLIKEVLTNAPALYSLAIRERDDVTDILAFLVRKDVYLRKLVLDSCYLGVDGTASLANIVDLYPCLEFLSLKGCSPLSSSAYRLITHLNKLSELNLSDCEKLSGKIVRLIAHSCQDLKKLRLDGVGQIHDGDVIHVIKVLGKQLTTLELSGWCLTDVAYLYLNNCARLQELEVSYCFGMTDRGLLEGIGSLHELTSLRLHLCRNLTAQALTTFLHQPSMTSIVSLNLSHCPNLDDEGLNGIATRCIHLKQLTICGQCNVTDASISTVISHCNQLCMLDLNYLPYITGNGWLELVPSYLPHLRRLCLSGCSNVSDKYLEELAASVPDLEIIKLFGVLL